MTLAVLCPDPSTNPLHFAAFRGDTKILNAHLSDETNLDAADHEGRTALHYAAYGNEAAIGAFIVECGADVNAVDLLLDTPLHAAARSGSRLVASMLLWGEADPLLQNASGETALHVAAKRGDRDIAWLLTENRGGDAAVEVKDSKGNTPLDYAKESGNSELVEMLAKCKAERGSK